MYSMHSDVLPTKMLAFTKTVIFQWHSPFHVLEVPTPCVLSIEIWNTAMPQDDFCVPETGSIIVLQKLVWYPNFD